MGRLLQSPQPLWTAPGFPIWARFAGKKYLVFVDETFNRFFEMDETGSRYGYFAYGGVGVPAEEYESLKDQCVAVFTDYAALVSGAKEFKHTEFKRLAFPDK